MARRRLDDFLPGVPDAGVGAGTPDIPFDQTAPEEVPVPITPPEEEGAPPGMIAGLGMPSEPGMSDQLSDEDLMSLAQEPGADQLSQAFSDPSIAPADRDLLQQRLALAARRRLAGAV